MKLELINTKTKDVNENHYELQEYKLTDGSGLEPLYYVDMGITVYGESAPVVRFSITPEYESYLPNIYYRDDFFGKKEPRFEVQTTSYGALKPDEFSAFVAAQVKALEVVSLLTETFLQA